MKRRPTTKWMHAALIAATLLMVACASGRELLRVRVVTSGAAIVASNGNATVIVADGRGLIEATTAVEPFAPVYPPLDWAGTYVRVVQHDPEFDSTYSIGAPLPVDAAAIVRSVMTAQQMADAGIRADLAP